jgi:hypothetical protein
MYLGNLHKKDYTHFATAEGSVGPLEAIFRTLDFKPMVFGTFAEASTSVGKFVEPTVEYGMEHMGRTMAATSVEVVKATLRRRYKTQIATAAWKEYATLVLDKTKYVGTGAAGINKAQVRSLIERMRGSLWGCTWLMRHMSQHGMPSPLDKGTLGGTL